MITNNYIAQVIGHNSGDVSKAVNNLTRTGRIEIVKHKGRIVGMRVLSDKKQPHRNHHLYGEIKTPALDSYVSIRASGSPLHRHNPIAEEGLQLKAELSLLRGHMIELEESINDGENRIPSGTTSTPT